MKKTILLLFAILISGFGQSQAQDNLLTNGDFENGRTSWTDTAGEIRTEGENSYFFAEVAQAGNAFDVNLAQVIAIEQGKMYALTFDASTGAGSTRSMIAGIGLNEGPWTNSTKTVNLTDQTQTFTLILTATEFGGANSRVLFDMGAEVGIVVIDNVSLEVTDNLLANGNFENGRSPWTDTAGEIRTDGDNSYFFAEVAQAGNAFDVNLSQVVAIEQGKTYALTFDASTGAGNARSIVAGIGLNEAPWTPETRTVNLTDQTQTFTLILTATEFGGANSRVVFDMGAEVGVVVIDNVSLVIANNLLVNGDFENGRTSWTETAGEIRTEGENSFYFAEVAQAGNAFDVNLSQIVDIQQGQKYTLSFDASTGEGVTRSMIVGIGLNEAPWSSSIKTVNLTDQTQTFTLALSAAEFGGLNSRVLFDMGAEVGIVVIDNVSLVVGAKDDGGTDPEGSGPSVFKAVDINFEADGMGQDFEWEVFENAGGSSLVVVDNPDKTGANTSDKVAAITINANGARWAGAVTGDIDAFIPARDNSNALIVTMMVWKKSITNIEFKFETGFPIKAGGAIVANTKTEQWEEITFTLRSPIMHPTELFRRMVIIPDFIAVGATRQENVVYFDNIRFSSYTPDYTIEDVVLPPTSAPVPTVTETPLSIFSDAFGNMGGGNYNPDWTQATQASIRSIGQDSMLVYRTLNHQGLEIGRSIDVSSYTYLHLHMYTDDATTVRVSLISGSAEKAYDLPITHGEWISYDIPVDHFASNVVLTDLRHFKFDDGGKGNFPTVFIDNIYFTNEMGTNVEDDTRAPETFTLSQNYPNPFNPSTNISYNVPNGSDVTLEVFTIQGQKVSTLVSGFQSAGQHTVSFDASRLASGMYMYRLTSGSISIVKKMALIK